MRDLIPSLVNTFFRCHSTVRGLRKSRSPISGFDSPSRARDAICHSCGRQLVARLDPALAHGLTGGQQFATGTLGERLDSHPGELVIGDAQLGAGVDPPTLAAQPFAIQQVRPRVFAPDAGSPEPLDGLLVERLGRGRLAEQSPTTRLDAKTPVGPARAR